MHSDYSPKSQFDKFQANLKTSEAKRLLAQLPRSIHFTIDDHPCNKSCAKNCLSNFKKYYYKNGDFVKMTDQNRIGSGGFGMVHKGIFHGKSMAMKCTLLSNDEVFYDYTDPARTISEMTIPKDIVTAGSGIIVPVAFVRQQNQEQDQNGEWIAKNYNIYVYPLYDGNLNELHKNYFDVFTEEILADIIAQCLKRKGFAKRILIKLLISLVGRIEIHCLS